MLLTNTATSSPGTALTWLAKPSRAWSGWLWLQIQFSVPALAFSAISQGAVGTVTPLASFVSTTAACPAAWCRLAFAGHPLLRVLGVEARRTGEPDGAERGELQELAAVDGALRWERPGVGATVRREGRHGGKCTHAPPIAALRLGR